MADHKYRVIVEIDEDARFEESNGKPRPLTAEEYIGAEYWGCPDHPFAGTQTTTVVDEHGDDPKQVQGCARCGRTDYRPLTHAEYLSYYGDPERHVYLTVDLDEACPTCGEYRRVGSLCGIDLMDDSPEWLAVSTDKAYPIETFTRDKYGYLADVAEELRKEAAHAAEMEAING